MPYSRSGLREALLHKQLVLVLPQKAVALRWGMRVRQSGIQDRRIAGVAEDVGASIPRIVVDTLGMRPEGGASTPGAGVGAEE